MDKVEFDYTLAVPLVPTKNSEELINVQHNCLAPQIPTLFFFQFVWKYQKSLLIV